jgi:hypothetical protein
MERITKENGHTVNVAAEEVITIQSNKDNQSAAINPQFDTAKLTLSLLTNHVTDLANDAVFGSENKGLFLVKPVNKWMKDASKRPVPKMLFGELWHECELCILFADTNLGKSILATQIADSISRGKQIGTLQLESEKQTVLYCDFEMTDKQFENRYSNSFTDPYIFADGFLRAEINPEGDLDKSFDNFEDYLNHSLEKSITETGAKVLIIDNITYLKSETERAKDALPLMKHLKALKRKYSLSILALAHTPKRDLTKPITRNDLQGSKMLINFCDSSFAIGESHSDKGIRYIKQIKQRNTENVYDSENVLVWQVSKPDNFLHFDFIGFGAEREHLKVFSETDRASLVEKVKELSQLGKSQRVISSELNISLGAVNKYLKI